MNYPKDAMARANLYVIQRKASMMLEMMPRGQEPPPWIEDNLATARTLMQQVCSYYLWMQNDPEAQAWAAQMEMAGDAEPPFMMDPQMPMPPQMPTPDEQAMAAQIGAGCATVTPPCLYNKFAHNFPNGNRQSWQFPPYFATTGGW